MIRSALVSSLWIASTCLAFLLVDCAKGQSLADHKCPNTNGSLHPAIIKGNRFFDSVTGEYIPIKGIAYYPRPNDGELSVTNSVDFFTEEFRDLWEVDIQNFQRLGINTVRIYGVNPSVSHDGFMCALEAAGIYAIIGLLADCEDCGIGAVPAPECYPASLKTRGQFVINAFSKYVNTLAFSAGNEVAWYAREAGGGTAWNAPCQKQFLRDMRSYLQTCSAVPNSILPRPIPVGVVTADFDRSIKALYFGCRTDPNDELENAEWYGLNAYQHCDPNAESIEDLAGYGRLLEDFSSYQLTIPTMLAEFGCRERFDAIGEFEAQRTWLQIDALYSEEYQDVFCGGIVFEYSAEKRIVDESVQNKPWPYYEFMKLNYGVGYYAPVDCDHQDIACTYNEYPEFQLLAEKYGSVDVTSFVPSLEEYEPSLVEFPVCPSEIAPVSDFEWESEDEPDLPCYVVVTPSPTQDPSVPPTASPSLSQLPTVESSLEPSTSSSSSPPTMPDSNAPSPVQSFSPTIQIASTAAPQTPVPTKGPTKEPTEDPTNQPTLEPTDSPTSVPTPEPSSEVLSPTLSQNEGGLPDSIAYHKCPNTNGSLHPAIIKGNRFFDSVTGEYIPIKGIAYYPRPNDGELSVTNSVDFFTEEFRDLWEVDIQNFQRLGINTVRIYGVNPSVSHDGFMCALEAAGIYAIIGLLADCEDCGIGAVPAPECYPASLKTRGQFVINAFSKYVNTLAFSAGNEVAWYAREAGGETAWNAPCQKQFLRDMRSYLQTCSAVPNSILPRQVPVGLVTADFDRSIKALYFGCRTDPNDELENAEWYGLNAYRHCNPNAESIDELLGYTRLLEDFSSFQLPIPTMVAEFGCRERFDAIGEFEAQRTWLQIDALYSEEYQDVFCGGIVFEYSAEKRIVDLSDQGKPWPYYEFMKLQYGVGYYAPVDCDHQDIACTYNEYPEFQLLAEKYGSVDVTSFVPPLEEYEPSLVDLPVCPSEIAPVSDFEWESEDEPDLPCYVVVTPSPTREPSASPPSGSSTTSRTSFILPMLLLATTGLLV